MKTEGLRASAPLIFLTRNGARFYGRFAFAVPELALAVRRIASMLHAQGMSFHEVGEEGIGARNAMHFLLNSIKFHSI